MEIARAKRENTWTLLSLAGPSGAGKTYSAILLARGLVGPEGKIGFIDTENKRSRFYAKIGGGFDVMDLRPPFSPARYIEAIQDFESAGYRALVIDSVSHEWEGQGGVVEMADAIEAASGKTGLHVWKKPKAEHKRFMHALLQTRMHLVFCCRAKELLKQVKDAKGKTEIVNEGFVAIQEKNFIYEMSVSMLLDPSTHIPLLTKCPEDLLSAFRPGEKITVATGEAIRAWAEEGEVLDEETEALLDVARSAANLGTEQLRSWFKKLPKPKQKIVKTNEPELKSMAAEADKLNAMAEAAAEAEQDTMQLGEPATNGNDAEEKQPASLFE